MSRISLIFFSFFTLILTGCGSMPNTPELLVQNVKSGSMFSEKEVFEVERPLSKVSKTLKKKSTECFRQRVANTSNTGGTGLQVQRTLVRSFTPKIVIGKKHTRLTLQSMITEGSTELGDMPKDGWYMMVVDAYKINKNKTRVETYFQQPSYLGAFSAIKHWATGSNMGCPDLTQ
ncbi:MAG: hypothetical protein OEY06_09380 [Gammaproteobacteria bacterium]|nr:hypothetical protein [Gammaproteobacteria bacterium]